MIETETRSGLWTVDRILDIDATLHRSVLITTIDALARYNRPSEITIIQPDVYVASMFKKMMEGTWEPAANGEEWSALKEYAGRHQISIETGRHSYSEWLISEMGKLQFD